MLIGSAGKMLGSFNYTDSDLSLPFNILVYTIRLVKIFRDFLAKPKRSSI